MTDRHKVVIVGGGFGGLNAVRALAHADVDVTVVDRTNHHLFQPLLYQVAAGILPPGLIAPALRGVIKKQANARAVLAEVTDIDLEGRVVAAKGPDGRPLALPYDTLVVAAGATHSYFGRDDFARYAPGMKTVENARHLRDAILLAFEMAEIATDPVERAEWLTCCRATTAPSTRRRPRSCSWRGRARCSARSPRSCASTAATSWSRWASTCGSTRWPSTWTTRASPSRAPTGWR
jgi:NAD(P)-dependent dehydrogenase (short-subunit alcohol dehydrogenase family)